MATEGYRNLEMGSVGAQNGQTTPRTEDDFYINSCCATEGYRNLEMGSVGRWWRQRDRKGWEGLQVVVVPLRVNVNLKAVTVEDLIARRKARPPPPIRVNRQSRDL